MSFTAISYYPPYPKGLTIYFTYGIWNSNERNRVSAKLYGCQSSKENISKEVAVRLQ